MTTALKHTAPREEREDFRRKIASVEALPAQRQLEIAYQAKLEGCSDRVAAELAQIPWWKIAIMLELGEDGHPVFEDLYLIWRRKKATATSEVQRTRYQKALQGDVREMDNHEVREYPEESIPVLRPEIAPRQAALPGSSHAIGGGLTVQIASFPAPQERKELPEVVEGEIINENGGQDA